MGTCWIKHLREEFTLSKCSPKPDIPQLMLRPQWRIHPVVWLGYRIFMGVYTLSWCVCSGVQYRSIKWFIFLSHLAYVMLTVYFNLALVNLICYMTLGLKGSTKQSTDTMLEEKFNSNTAVVEVEASESSGSCRVALLPVSSALHSSLSVQWILHNLINVHALFVTIAFWSLEYQPGHTQLDSVNLNMHLVNSVLVLAELGLIAAPIHLLHVLYVQCFCTMYIVFTVIYWSAGGTNTTGKAYIYWVIDYQHRPGLAAGCNLVIDCIAMPTLQFLAWNLHLLRRCDHLSLCQPQL
ncbi:protein rolling stone [Callorhinchus milii]|uniref:protein rolling stone n=1 Tax=Callorhinchus milii TaxID=7868 RepID=UPI000457639D|nr:protein rolling stone [Callorhinchus milii]|eukprot:gi/632946299/ref/XP_007888490.1/ PREDICTED: uncharacterized protein LOC103176641 [Callorhinchus milii]